MTSYRSDSYSHEVDRSPVARSSIAKPMQRIYISSVQNGCSSKNWPINNIIRSCRDIAKVRVKVMVRLLEVTVK